MIPVYPDCIPTRWDWRLITNTQRFTSPLNGSQQFNPLPGSIWSVRMNYRALKGEKLARIRAFLAELGGPSARCYVPLIDAKRPRGQASANARVNGSQQLGRQISTHTWPANTVKLLLQGDYVQIGDHVYMVTRDVDSDAAGRAELQIAPALRTPAQHNQDVIVINPACIMRLKDDNQIAWRYSTSQYAALNIEFIEAI